ncbi:hypothetical protein CXG81DRAFT_28025 [Caulochytrium protostelioides]|uniref:Phosphatidylinositol N-acetylglucosaminyltransferase subunit H conserved domain-containing protein n=1 Tax=Caulochytrium protostelioides TaxID=1555241 RepID=A0A4P9X1T4_9FUNG|nr:hypothetical protein CXG81DRAFT_28025 [Caulochytrium protostelioides]|eukprot:RKO99202.1 hypothetical protein CXG81DRAFT_28025 [Caulochytrium protostelioides]
METEALITQAPGGIVRIAVRRRRPRPAPRTSAEPPPSPFSSPFPSPSSPSSPPVVQTVPMLHPPPASWGLATAVPVRHVLRRALLLVAVLLLVLLGALIVHALGAAPPAASDTRAAALGRAHVAACRTLRETAMPGVRWVRWPRGMRFLGAGSSSSSSSSSSAVDTALLSPSATGHGGWRSTPAAAWLLRWAVTPAGEANVLSGLAALAAALTTLVLLARAATVVEEAVTVIPGMGLQLTTTDGLGRTRLARFLPKRSIANVCLTEGTFRFTMQYRLVVILHEETTMQVCFRHLQPRLVVLKAAWKAIQATL